MYLYLPCCFLQCPLWRLCCSHLIFWCFFSLKNTQYNSLSFILLIYQPVREVFCVPQKLVHAIIVYWFVLQEPTLQLSLCVYLIRLNGLLWFLYITVIWFNKVIKNDMCLKEYFFICIVFVWRKVFCLLIRFHKEDWVATTGRYFGKWEQVTSGKMIKY